MPPEQVIRIAGYYPESRYLERYQLRRYLASQSDLTTEAGRSRQRTQTELAQLELLHAVEADFAAGTFNPLILEGSRLGALVVDNSPIYADHNDQMNALITLMYNFAVISPEIAALENYVAMCEQRLDAIENPLAIAAYFQNPVFTEMLVRSISDSDTARTYVESPVQVRAGTEAIKEQSARARLYSRVQDLVEWSDTFGMPLPNKHLAKAILLYYNHKAREGKKGADKQAETQKTVAQVQEILASGDPRARVIVSLSMNTLIAEGLSLPEGVALPAYPLTATQKLIPEGEVMSPRTQALLQLVEIGETVARDNPSARAKALGNMIYDFFFMEMDQHAAQGAAAGPFVPTRTWLLARDAFLTSIETGQITEVMDVLANVLAVSAFSGGIYLGEQQGTIEHHPELYLAWADNLSLILKRNSGLKNHPNTGVAIFNLLQLLSVEQFSNGATPDAAMQDKLRTARVNLIKDLKGHSMTREDLAHQLAADLYDQPEGQHHDTIVKLIMENGRNGAELIAVIKDALKDTPQQTPKKPDVFIDIIDS